MIAAVAKAEDLSRLFLEEVPDPVPGADDVVVRVGAAAFAAGTFRLLPTPAFPLLPTILGHEIAGEVVEIGADVDPGLLGARVRVHPLLGCGTCEYCAADDEMLCAEHSMMGHASFGPRAITHYERYHNGGLAEKVLVPAANIDVLPDDISTDLAAKIHDIANAYRALTKARLRPGSTLAVTAATGAMGTSTILLAPYFGVSRVVAIGRDAARLEDVRQLDPDRVVTVELDDEDSPETVVGRVRAAAGGGVDAVIDFLPSGNGLTKVFGSLRDGGRIVHMGMNSDPLFIPQIAMSVRCISFIGTRSCTRADVKEVLRIVAADPASFERLITHRYPLSRVNEARRVLESRSEPVWMSVIHPDDESDFTASRGRQETSA
ncbi:alcohol dehydrogenase catalytic domain-containing protein [Microbacterium sp. 22242]|uniref:alcohol dehydrogenase catalytic domain-containing protein n=1 Tax=Microbacterium sp. 22242 TaxID=3453896 RepID=UPI003F84015B